MRELLLSAGTQNLRECAKKFFNLLNSLRRVEAKKAMTREIDKVQFTRFDFLEII